MKSTTEHLLTLMCILAWISFVGLLVEAGAIITSYLVSIGNAQAAGNLYKGLNLSAYRQYSFFHYTLVVGYNAILLITQAYIAFLMTRFLSRLNIARPFNTDTVKLMQKISYGIVGVWVVAMAHNIHVSILEEHAGLLASQISAEYIFLAGIVYVLAQMFKRGVEMQSENELTI